MTQTAVEKMKYRRKADFADEAVKQFLESTEHFMTKAHQRVLTLCFRQAISYHFMDIEEFTKSIRVIAQGLDKITKDREGLYSAKKDIDHAIDRAKRNGYYGRMTQQLLFAEIENWTSRVKQVQYKPVYEDEDLQ